MTHWENLSIEQDLLKSVTASFESPKANLIKDYVQSSVLTFFLTNSTFDIDESLAYLNTMLPSHMQVSKDIIMPQTKREQRSLVNVELFSYLNSNYAILDQEKQNQIVSRFCQITQIDPDFVEPLINKKIKDAKRELIEKTLYTGLQNCKGKVSAKDRAEAIKEFSEVLGVTPEYVDGVLKRKAAQEKKQKKVPTKLSTNSNSENDRNER